MTRAFVLMRTVVALLMLGASIASIGGCAASRGTAPPTAVPGPAAAGTPGPGTAAERMAVPSSAKRAAARAGAAALATECFPFEQLSDPLRRKAEAMLLGALDSEALYTIAGGLKPVSSGLATYRVKVDAPDVAEIEDARQILRTWRCGHEVAAGVHAFAAVREGMRLFDAFVVHRPSLARMLEARRAFFAPYGLSPSADPLEVVLAVEHDPTTARLRGYGYLFGYPDYAIDFFVQAADSEKETKQFVKRDFLSIPTVKGETNRFVYAVPQGHQENDADRALKAAALPIYQDYVARRARHIKGADATGVLDLVRAWFADGKGGYAPSRVRAATAATP